MFYCRKIVYIALSLFQKVRVAFFAIPLRSFRNLFAMQKRPANFAVFQPFFILILLKLRCKFIQRRR